MNEFLEQAIDNTAANVAFGVIVLVCLGMGMMGMLFVGLWVRAAWRWFSRARWNDVIVSSERKAFRRS